MNEKISNKTNALNWFEISVEDINRAKNFYEHILQIEMHSMEMMGQKMAMFPADDQNGKVGGAIAQSEMHAPSDKGALIYLNANPNLQLVLDRVENAGGNIAMPKTEIGGNGFMAFINDTEGNVVGLHSNE